MLTIDAIKSRYYSIAQKLHAPPSYVRFALTPQHDGSPHLEQNGDAFCYVITERGVEFQRRTTASPETLLYWLVSDLTWAMANNYENRNRIPNQDSRRLLFSKQLELLSEIKHEWFEFKKAEYDMLLAQHPFSDPEPE